MGGGSLSREAKEFVNVRAKVAKAAQAGPRTYGDTHDPTTANKITCGRADRAVLH